CTAVSIQRVQPYDLGIQLRLLLFFRADVFQIGFKIRSAQDVVGMYIIQCARYMCSTVILYGTLDHLQLIPYIPLFVKFYGQYPLLCLTRIFEQIGDPVYYFCYFRLHVPAMAAQYDFFALKAGYTVRAYFFSTEIPDEQLTRKFAQLHFNGS